MGGSSRGPTTVTQSNSEPWGPAQPYLNENMQRASQFYNVNPYLTTPYSGTTVIPFSQRSTQGINFSEGVANRAMSPMQNPLTAYSGMMDTLSPIAQGDFTNDTTFNNNLGRAQQDAAQQVNLSMSGAGRYGSGAHTERMANTIGDMTNRAMLDRQQFASNAMLNYGNAMPQAYQSALAPAQTLMSLGQMDENLAGNYAQEQMDRYNATGDMLRRNIMEQQAIYTGSGGLGGSSSGMQSVRTPGMSGTQMAGMGLSTAGRLAGGKG